MKAEHMKTEYMKSLQIVAPGQPAWTDVPVPRPGPGEALVKVEGVTTCPHWDMHLMDGVPMFAGRDFTYPFTPGQPGHEAVGEVTALGTGVEGLEVGDRVAAFRDMGNQRPGFYAHFNAFPAEALIRVPRSLPAAAIAPLELAMCVQVSFDQLVPFDAVEGKRFGIAGLGPAGLIALQLARAYGAAEVVGFDPLPARRELAASLGADRVLAPDSDAFAAGRQNADALDAAIDCTGFKSAIQYLMDRTRQVVTIFGVLRETIEYEAHHRSGGLALLGYANHNRGAAERALAQIEAGRLDLSPLVSRTLPLSRYAEGVQALRDKEAVKILFEPWSE
jgi:threonine dehydrogenase-like Zn-dependent dehydrogenase